MPYQLFLFRLKTLTSNKPSKQETVECRIKWIGLGIFLASIFIIFVLAPLNEAGQILDDTKAAANNQVDWNHSLSWTMVFVYRP